jgi:protein-S-isoprenylcysteine O-methyltransferase Ste14
MKRHQLENIVPFAFTLCSFYIIASGYQITALFISGTLLTSIGLAVWWAGKLALGDSFSAFPKAKRLIMSGIYSRLRHPIYTGLSTMLLGWCVIIQNLTIALITLGFIICLIIRAYLEEKILTKKFGKTYLNYKKNTLF